MGVSMLLCVLFSTILYLIYLLSKKKFNYWKKKQVPFIKPSLILGNYGKYILQKEYMGHTVQKLCKKFSDKPYFGAFFGTEPVLIVQDPDLINTVLTKDFYYYNGREVSDYMMSEPMNQAIMFTSGNPWKIIRNNLTPLFSIVKMKNMFYLIIKCSRDFENLLNEETSVSNVIEAQNLMSRFAMDCICSCAFGVDANTMKDVENNPFKLMASEIFKSSAYRGFKMIFRAIWPAIFYGVGFKYFPDSINMFFKTMLTNVYKSRNYEPSSRHDFVDLLLNLKKADVISSDCISKENQKAYLKVDDNVLAVQSVGFFGAGFETSSTVLSFTLYELAKNPVAQVIAAKEVDEYLKRHNNELDYECVNELPYLESCFNEAMRLYPVVGVLTRDVMDDATLPTGLNLDKGVRVHIPVYHLHHNPDYFPDPEEYKPERFMPENRSKIKPNTYFPYGGGARTCIGKRFAKMQVLAGLVTFLKTYRVELAEGMPGTVDLEPRALLTQPKSHQGIFLKTTKRDGWEKRNFI